MIDRILSRPGVTRTAAVAENVPVSVTTEALTLPGPSLRGAVKVVVLPAAGESVPVAGGVSDQVAETGKSFPKTSEPAAANCCERRTGTLTEAGVTARATSGPGVTVTV